MKIKISSIFIIFCMLTSLCAFAQGNIDAIASWKMDNLVKSGSIAYIEDSLNTGNRFVGYYKDNTSIVNVAKNSEQKAVYGSGSSYYYLSTPQGQVPENILSAFDNKYTAEIWINMTTSSTSAIFGVFNGSTFLGQLGINKRSETGMGVVYRRMWQSGQQYFECPLELSTNKWYHIILSHDLSSTANMPLLIVNGEKISLREAFSNASGTVKPHTPGTSTVEFGRSYADNGVSQFLPRVYYGSVNFYDDVITEQKAVELYNEQKNSYENGYNSYIYQDGIEVLEYKNIPEGDFLWKTELLDIDKSTINEITVKMVDENGNPVSLERSWESDNYIAKTDFLEQGNYKLILSKEIKTTDTKKYRSIDFVIDISVVENVVLRQYITNELNILFADDTKSDEAVMQIVLRNFNYILKLNVGHDSEFSKIINKQNVFRELREKTDYSELNEITTAFNSCVVLQKDKDVSDAANEVVAMSKSSGADKINKMKDLLFVKYDTVFKLDRSVFDTLSDSDEVIKLLFNLTASSYLDIIEKFNSAVESVRISERKAEFFENLKIATTETLESLLIEYADIHELDLENADFTANKTDVISNILTEDIKNVEMLVSIFNKSVLLNALNAVPVGNREKIKELLKTYKDFWSAPVEFSDLSEQKKEMVYQKLNGIIFTSLDGLSLKVSQIIQSINQSDLDKTPSGNAPSSSGISRPSSHKTGNFNLDVSVTDKAIPATEPKITLPFEDLEDVPWAIDGIQYFYDNNIISGRNEKEFAPHESILRSEFSKIVSIAFKIESDSTKPVFDDLNEEDWSFPYIMALYDAGILKGKNENISGKDDYLSRSDLAVVMQRIIEYKNIDMEVKSEKIYFNDDDSIPDYAKDAVYKMQMHEVVSGEGNNMFNPNGNVTRAAAAKVIYLVYHFGNGGNN